MLKDKTNNEEGITQDNAKETKAYTSSASQEGKIEVSTAGTVLQCTSNVNEKDQGCSYTVEKMLSASQEGMIEVLTAGTVLECTSNVNEKGEGCSGVKAGDVIVSKDTTESSVVVHPTSLMFEVSGVQVLLISFPS